MLETFNPTIDRYDPRSAARLFAVAVARFSPCHVPLRRTWRLQPKWSRGCRSLLGSHHVPALAEAQRRASGDLNAFQKTMSGSFSKAALRIESRSAFRDKPNRQSGLSRSAGSVRYLFGPSSRTNNPPEVNPRSTRSVHPSCGILQANIAVQEEFFAGSAGIHRVDVEHSFAATKLSGGSTCESARRCFLLPMNWTFTQPLLEGPKYQVIVNAYM